MSCIRLTTILVLLANLASGTHAADQTSDVSQNQIVAVGDEVASAQLKALEGKSSIDWVAAAFYAGLADFTHVSPHKEGYLTALKTLANAKSWETLFHPKTPYMADDLCMGQAYLDLYASHPEPAEIAPLKKRLDDLVEHLNTDPVDPTKLTWWWCDALFMAPPVLTRMSAITGDHKYIDAMDKEYWRTTTLLYDKTEHLFYRDNRFPTKLDKNGKKIFWARGNGWVVGGLVRILEHMPADYPSRPKYIALYQELMLKLSTLPAQDGTWPSNLTDPNDFPGPETSGTAFYVYGMAWGINNKLLDRKTYLPVALKGWAAMLAARRPDGLPAFVQGVAYAPGHAKATGTQLYTSGAYLMAAGELQQLAPFELPKEPHLEEVALADPAAKPKIAPASETATAASPRKAYARYVPERMDDIAWENDRIAHRIYGPALEHNPKEHSGSGIDVWAKSVRTLVIDDWYRGGHYHADNGTGLDFYEVGLSRGAGGLGIWDGGKLYVSKDWIDYKMLDKGPDECGFNLTYAPWIVGADATAGKPGRKVWEHRTMTLKAGSNLDRIETTIDSDTPGELIIGIGLASRPGKGGHLYQDKERGILSYWQPPEKSGTIGVGVSVDPSTIVGFEQDPLNYLVLVRATAGKPFVYYAGACWDRGLDFKTSDQWEQYLKNFKRE